MTKTLLVKSDQILSFWPFISLLLSQTTILNYILHYWLKQQKHLTLIFSSRTTRFISTLTGLPKLDLGDLETKVWRLGPGTWGLGDLKTKVWNLVRGLGDQSFGTWSGDLKTWGLTWLTFPPDFRTSARLLRVLERHWFFGTWGLPFIVFWVGGARH